MTELKRDEVGERLAKDWGHVENYFSKRDKQVSKWYELASGDQWEKDAVQKLDQEDRPHLTFDQIGPVLDTVFGTEVANRTTIKYQPRTRDDQGGVDLLNEYLRHQRELAHAEHEESMAYRDCGISGVGCTELWVDNDDSGYMLVRNERLHHGDYRWDAKARKMCLEDREWDMRGRWMSNQELKRFFGEEIVKDILEVKMSSELSEGDWEGHGNYLHDQTMAFLYDESNRGPLKKPGNLTLVNDYQYVRMEEARLVVYPDGSRNIYFGDQLTPEMEMQLMQQGVDLRMMQEMDVPRWRRAFLVAGHTIEDEWLDPNMPTRHFITGYEDHSDPAFTNWFGLVSRMQDPQEWTNKLLSQLMYILSISPKGAVIAETGAVADKQKAMREWAKAGGWIDANPGGKDKIEILRPNVLPPGMMDLMMFGVQAVPKAAHVNLEYMGGQASDLKRTSGSSVEMIQKAGGASLSAFTDAFKRYRRNVGRGYLKYIQQFADPKTVVRVGGEMMQEFVELGLSPLFNYYDVVVDEKPTEVTSMYETWRTLTDQGQLEQLIQGGLFPPALLTRMVPGLTEEVRRQWEEFLQGQQQAQEEQGQGEQGPPLQ